MAGNNNSFTGRGETVDKIVGFLVVLALFAIIIVPSVLFSNKDKFQDIIYPKAGDAFLSGWYRTLGRECKPNLHKCKVNERYFCSERADCTIPQYNVIGKKVKEPMSWFDRYA